MSVSQPQEQTINHSISADADLLLRLRIALSIQRRAGWHLVRFTAQHGVVHLVGSVPAYYDRQLIIALVRHVAGVRGIKDNLSVGDPSIRQQVIDDETITLPTQKETSAARLQDPFKHVPTLLQSLDDVLVGSPLSVL
jgi:osmotically-inducible protein OsmY